MMKNRVGNAVLTCIAVILIFNLHNKAKQTCDFSLSSSSSSFQARPNAEIPSLLRGYFPGWDRGTVIDRSTLDASAQEIVPERVIAVFGLESSGARFVHETLARAMGAEQRRGPERLSEHQELRLQHLPLPFGNFTKEDPDFDKRFEPLPIVPVFVPQPCRLDPREVAAGDPSPAPSKCHALFGPERVPSETRYFINVTSHILFYRRRGIQATAVLVVRDPALHFKGITRDHCPNQTAAFEQFQTGRMILQQAMERLDLSSVVVVSYETLMTLQDVYLQEIYKALGISSTYRPKYQNGNIRYISENVIPKSVAQKLQQDEGIPKYVTLAKNMYEPQSWAELQKQG